EPFLPGADMISTVEFSGSEGLDVFLPSAGGKWSMTGDYVWSNGRLPYSQSGQWGYLRVLPSTDQRIQPLDGSAMSSKQAALEEPNGEPRIIPTVAR
ncbi:MAG TPA: hypothetical protein PKM72_11395, partial [Nitrospirales bacterium]|nr:hypothetical protein [Nitrospirales bacterium]